jgi:6-pyruvoyltetrahydropterin/6-carboxytetrahydropterin synthase
MKWEISKSFDFCYGHRVWSQKLDVEFSLDKCLKCRHLHGHQAKIVVYLGSDKLVDGMVTDFNHLNWLKSFLDDTIDHKFIIDINDPLFKTMLPSKVVRENLHNMGEFMLPDLSLVQNDLPEITELYESFIVVDFIPTSENISTWLLGIIQKKMSKLDVDVIKIEFYESPKSKSVVYAN